MSGAKSMQPKGRSPRIYRTGRRHGSRCKSIFAGIKTERRKVLAIDTRRPRQSPRIHKR